MIRLPFCGADSAGGLPVKGPEATRAWRLCRRVVLALFCLLGFLGMDAGLHSAFASTATSTFTVTSTVAATCLVSATNLAFGSYTGVVNNATSTISVTCTNTTTYNVGMNPGTASGATVTTRKMGGTGGALLSYALYSDSARSVNWGQTVGTDTVAGTGTGSAQSLTVYGQVPAAQYPTPGAYTDTITVTVTY